MLPIIKIVLPLVLTIGLSFTSNGFVIADAGHHGTDSGTIGAEVSTPGDGSNGSGSGAGESSGNGTGGPVGSNGPGGSGGSGESVPIYCEETGADPATCLSRPATVDGPAAAPEPVAAVVVAAIAREEITIEIPRPHTSPDDAAQMTGLRTWFWLQPDRWTSSTARAELPGVWAEVTATPIQATWNPGDGGSPVTCDGPGRPHPGTSKATTDCGHVYTTIGHYALGVTVTYQVTWRSSTGETGVLDPLVLTTSLPITVEQRQVVTS